MAKLTKRTIDATTPRPTADIFLWDDDIPGFGLRVKPSGAKSFLAQYRNGSGRSRRITVGRYGVLTPEEGRQRVRQVLADVARGGDPAANRSDDRKAMTVADLSREYLDRCQRGHVLTRRGVPKKASTLSTDVGRIERHIIPLLGRRTVKEIASADLRAFVRDVAAGKTAVDVKTKARGRAIVRGGKGTAARTMALVSTIFSYAVDEQYRSDNPARGVKVPAYGRRRNRLSEEQYRTLGAALDQATARGEPWQAVLGIQLMAVTGCRRSEITGLARSEVEIRACVLRLKDTKTGESVRPLGSAALALLGDALLRSNDRFVFPAVRAQDAAYGGIAKAWARIIKPVLPGVTPHTLRHSFASVSDDLGYTDATTGALLGHSGRGTTRGYIHKLDPALIAAADRVSAHIATAMVGKLETAVVAPPSRDT